MGLTNAIVPLASKSIAEIAVPGELKKNFIELDNDKILELKECLVHNYKNFSEPGYLDSREGKMDLENHLAIRLMVDRRAIVPWLNHARPLRNAKILEIGCGTGASSVALAEQGAILTGIDVDPKSLVVARKRCELYGVDADFVECNATEVTDKFQDSDFDFIIFFASLEHMTFQERLVSMNRTWNLLKPGKIWVITETPNRLWYYDSHTSLLPFYNWLPDDIAYDYSSFSKRYEFNELSNNGTRDLIRLARYGRGISYHEFELAMGPIESLDIISNLSEYGLYNRSQAFYQILASKGLRRSYESMLKKIKPGINSAFTKPMLDIMIRKN
jgi:S-adenosylmethionine-dependent methyltransferase